MGEIPAGDNNYFKLSNDLNSLIILVCGGNSCGHILF